MRSILISAQENFQPLRFVYTLRGPVDTLESTATVQRNLDKLMERDPETG